MKTNSSQYYLPQKQQSWMHIPGGIVKCTNCYKGREAILSFQHSPLSKLQHSKTRKNDFRVTLHEHLCSLPAHLYYSSNADTDLPQTGFPEPVWPTVSRMKKKGHSYCSLCVHCKHPEQSVQIHGHKWHLHTCRGVCCWDDLQVW